MPFTAAQIPVNEADRLAALHGLAILDTLPERAYDDLTLLASQVCNTPIAMVALIDADRQWYKSTIGTTLKETQRNVAFCAHAILEPQQLFTVEDAASDPRFDDNPFVTGEPHIRFYAGAPIVMSSGEAIGTMCVIDTQPRVLDDAQKQSLAALARQASLLLDLRAQAISSERVARESEQSTVEARLKQKRGMELLELVLRGGQMGLWDLHVPSGVWTVNAREHLMLGYANVAAPDQLDWRSLVHPDDWPALTEAMEPHLNGRAAFYECTHRMRHADGHDLWVLDRGVIVERNVRGEALRIVGTHVDVTDNVRLDEERRRNTERLQLALSGDDSGLWDWHVDGGTAVPDARWARLFGYTLAEIAKAGKARPMWSLALPADADAADAEFDRYRLGLVARFEVELRVRHKDGRLLWARERGIAVERDANGHAIRIIGTTMVIDERKKNELALRRANDLLVLTGRMARVGGWSVDLATNEVYWSEEIYRLHELNPASRPDLKQATGFFTPESRPVIEAAIIAARMHGTPWDLELSLVTARGRRVRIRTLGTVEYDDDKPARIIGTAQDITDRKEADLQRIDDERSLRFITDSLPSPITRLDRDERCDPLTGLANRSQFEQRLDAAMGRTRESGDATAVVCLAVDHLASINDTHGHAVGDAVLTECAARLVRAVGDVDVAVARLAGSTFVVLREGLGHEDEATAAHDELVAAMRPAFIVSGMSIDVTARVGVAIHRGDPLDAETLFSRAIRAMDGDRDVP